MGRALRYQYNLKIRQPLKSVEFVTRNADEKTVLLSMEESIREELNVKKVVFHEREDELVEYKAKANFRTLGKELGPLMKEASALIAGLDQRSIQSVLDGAVLSIEIGGKPIELTQDKIIVERFEKSTLKVVNEGTLTVALDSEITEELRLEGYARDLVRGVHNLRKERGLNVTDRIKLSVGADKDKDGELKKAFEMFSDYISSETLASEERWNDRISGAALIETGELTWKAEIEKA